MVYYHLNLDVESLNLLNSSEKAGLATTIVHKIGDCLCRRMTPGDKKKLLRSKLNLLLRWLHLYNTSQIRNLIIIRENCLLNIDELNNVESELLVALMLHVISMLVSAFNSTTDVGQVQYKQILDKLIVQLKYVLKRLEAQPVALTPRLPSVNGAVDSQQTKSQKPVYLMDKMTINFESNELKMASPKVFENRTFSS